MVQSIRRMFLSFFMAAASFHKQIDTIAHQEAQGVEEQVINVGHSAEKRKLQDFDEKGNADTGGDDFFVGIQLLEYQRPDDAEGEEHCGVANEVQQGFPALGVVHQVYKGDQIDTEGENLGRIQKQGLNPTVDFAEGKESKTGYDDDADIDQDKLDLPFPTEMVTLDGKGCSKQNPQKSNGNHCGGVRDFYHFACSLVCDYRDIQYSMEKIYRIKGNTRESADFPGRMFYTQ